METQSSVTLKSVPPGVWERGFKKEKRVSRVFVFYLAGLIANIASSICLLRVPQKLFVNKGPFP